MIVIPLHATVECTDGACGESVTVIVNPITKKVTHFVVKDKTLPPPAERLVPIEEVVETTSEMVRLRLRRDEMATLKPFIETQYVESDELVPVYGTYDSFSMSPYVTAVGTHQLPIEVEQIPPGALAVYRGSRVEGTDGYVGKVGELLVDPESGHITHLVMQEGHLRGKKEVTIPISTIDHVMADTVYLKLDRRSIEMLPAVPVKRHFDSSGEKYKQIGLVAKVFDEALMSGNVNNPHFPSAGQLAGPRHRPDAIGLANEGFRTSRLLPRCRRARTSIVGGPNGWDATRPKRRSPWTTDIGSRPPATTHRAQRRRAGLE